MTTGIPPLDNFLSTFLSTFSDIYTALSAFLQSVFAMIQTGITSSYEICRSMMTFLFNNLILIGVVCAGLMAYSSYVNRSKAGTTAHGAALKGDKKG
ncbi:hypothetical protein RUND412_006385 [Rhizina undulata]